MTAAYLTKRRVSVSVITQRSLESLKILWEVWAWPHFSRRDRVKKKKSFDYWDIQWIKNRGSTPYTEEWVKYLDSKCMLLNDSEILKNSRMIYEFHQTSAAKYFIKSLFLNRFWRHLKHLKEKKFENTHQCCSAILECCIVGNLPREVPVAILSWLNFWKLVNEEVSVTS